MNISIGRSGFGLCAISSRRSNESNSFESGEIRVELVLTSDAAKSHFETLGASRAAIETDLGYEVTWHNPEDAKSAKIHVRETADIRDPEKWGTQSAWLLERLEDFKRVFGPRVRTL